jgi:hypothetical protein
MERLVLSSLSMDAIASHVHALCAELFPGAEVTSLSLLGQPAESREASDKACGYGTPLRIDLRMPDGEARRVVLHTATPNEFGHDRRADRAAAALLAFDTMGTIPRHVPVLDAGAVTASGRLLSLGRAGELYLLTGYADGSVYAEDLAHIARARTVADRDRARARILTEYLVALHARKAEETEQRVGYQRAVRDLLGSGEGIFGIVDGYPAKVPGAPPDRLAAIERRCLEWRWKLRERHDRLTRTHGDFHPFNIVFDEASNLTLLDASRGCAGDPADDVACLSINYLFFAFDTEGAWPALRELWYQVWDEYLRGSGDDELLSVVAPFLAWRALVLASPRWYPAFGERPRDRLLALVERALAADRFDPGWAEGVFA